MSRYIPEGVRLELIERDYHDDCRDYTVIEKATGRVIGTVESYRSESWMSNDAGVRYHYRGKPKEWSANRPGEWGGPYLYDTRRSAIERLLRNDRFDSVLPEVEAAPPGATVELPVSSGASLVWTKFAGEPPLSDEWRCERREANGSTRPTKNRGGNATLARTLADCGYGHLPEGDE